MKETNILASIPGPYIGAALQALSDAAVAQQDILETTIDVPGRGPGADYLQAVLSQAGQIKSLVLDGGKSSLGGVN